MRNPLEECMGKSNWLRLVMGRADTVARSDYRNVNIVNVAGPDALSLGDGEADRSDGAMRAEPGGRLKGPEEVAEPPGKKRVAPRNGRRRFFRSCSRRRGASTWHRGQGGLLVEVDDASGQGGGPWESTGARSIGPVAAALTTRPTLDADFPGNVSWMEIQRYNSASSRIKTVRFSITLPDSKPRP